MLDVHSSFEGRGGTGKGEAKGLGRGRNGREWVVEGTGEGGKEQRGT